MNNGKKLRIEFPSEGWRQILASRKEMLSAYDLAKEWSVSHKVQVLHGKVGEAVVRDWLTRFLPRRYGVTSGYIVSPGLKSGEKTPHYDVIIYDVLNSPILWIESSPDISLQGRAIAIPVEHVYCVLEVKSSFSLRNVREALTHLNDLKPFLSGIDDQNEKYKLHLRPEFCWGLLFFEMNRNNQFSIRSLEALADGANLRGFLTLPGHFQVKGMAGSGACSMGIERA